MICFIVSKQTVQGDNCASLIMVLLKVLCYFILIAFNGFSEQPVLLKTKIHNQNCSMPCSIAKELLNDV